MEEDKENEANFASNTAIRFEQKEGQDHLILTWPGPA